MTTTPEPRQPALTGLHCHYTARPDQRPDCEGLAIVSYGSIALCAACDLRRSAVGRTHAARKLPGAQLARLAEAADNLAQAEAALNDAANQARQAGASWAHIGDAAGISRQAAQQRWHQP